MAMVFFTFILGNLTLFNDLKIDILILVRYQRVLKRMKVLRLIPPKANCWKAGLIPKLFLELIICSTISPPGVDFTFSGSIDGGRYQYRYNILLHINFRFSFDSVMNIIALLKSYLIVRIYWHYCSWNTNSAKRTAKRNDHKIDLLFAIKSELKYRPFVMVGFIMVVSIFYLGFIIRTCEL